MEIKHEQSNGHGIFYMEHNGNRVGKIVYSKHNNTIVLEHTEVDEALQGKDYGYQLVRKAVDYARSHHIKIVPVCSFAKAVLEKETEFRDVLA